MNAPAWKCLSEALLTLQECTLPSELGPALLRSMQVLIDADVYAINWFGVEKILDVSYYAGPSGEVALENSRETEDALALRELAVRGDAKMIVDECGTIGQILVNRNSCFETQIGFPKCQEVATVAETFSRAQPKVIQAG